MNFWRIFKETVFKSKRKKSIRELLGVFFFVVANGLEMAKWKPKQMCY